MKQKKERSAEHKAKLSESIKQYDAATNNTRVDKIKKANTGKYRTKEQIENITKAQNKRRASAETDTLALKTKLTSKQKIQMQLMLDVCETYQNYLSLCATRDLVFSELFNQIILTRFEDRIDEVL